MTKGEDSHSEMARVRQSDCINVIFDQNSPASSRSCSRSRSSCCSRRSFGYRGRGSHRGRYRSSSSSSSSRSSSRSRSRSHPRCHRPSSRCRCDNHHRYVRGLRSPPRRYRAHSHSYSRSPSPYRHSHNQRHRSRSRSSSRLSRYRRAVSRVPWSPPKTHKSRSRSTGLSVNLSLNDKAKLLEEPNVNAPMILGGEKLQPSKGVKPILSESRQVSPETWVRQDPEKDPSQSMEVEPDMFGQKMSQKRKIISFSMNNSVVKPITAAPSCAKVTSRVDSYESRKPYGHWVPVKSGQTPKARKHAFPMSH